MSSFLDLSKPIEVICFRTMKFKTAKVKAVGVETISGESGEIGDNKIPRLWFSVEFEDGFIRKLPDAFGTFKDDWRYIS